MSSVFARFWQWYEQHYVLNTGIAAGLFVIQLVHLYWLTADVAMLRLVGQSYFDLEGIWRIIITVVDYTEIPAIISVSLVYINQLRKQFGWQPVLYLLLLNSQWLHIFWITDEFVVSAFTGGPEGTVLPVWLAWVAILIDYLELPVMYDTVKSFIVALKERRVKDAMAAFKEDEGPADEASAAPQASESVHTDRPR